MNSVWRVTMFRASCIKACEGLVGSQRCRYLGTYVPSLAPWWHIVLRINAQKSEVANIRSLKNNGVLRYRSSYKHTSAKLTWTLKIESLFHRRKNKLVNPSSSFIFRDVYVKKIRARVLTAIFKNHQEISHFNRWFSVSSWKKSPNREPLRCLAL